MNQISQNHLADLAAIVGAPPAGKPKVRPSSEPQLTAANTAAKGFGKRLRQARRDAGMTPARLAKASSVDVEAIRHIEKNDACYGIEPARDLAGALKVDMTWLWLGRQAVQRTKLAPETLTGIADRIVAGQLDLGAMDRANPDADYDSGPNAAILTAWWDLVGMVLDQPVNSAADVVALARICRALWAQTPGDECDLRDALDQKLQQAVLAHGLVAPPAVAAADTELHAINVEAAGLLVKRRPLETRWWAVKPGDTKGSAELEAVAGALEPIDDRLDALSERAALLRAASPDAFAAKARA